MATYHEQSRRTFGGAKKISLDEEGSRTCQVPRDEVEVLLTIAPTGKYLHKSIRASALTAVDELVRNIANLHISNR